MTDWRLPVWVWFLVGLILGAVTGWLIGVGRGLPNNLNTGHTIACAMFGSLLVAGFAVVTQSVIARIRALANR